VSEMTVKESAGDIVAGQTAVGAVPGAGGLDAGDEQLVRLLAERAQAGGTSLAGEGGLLAQLTKLVLEAGLEAEFDAHLGYEPHERTGSANARNGSRAKTVLTEVGPVTIEVPRDRDASFTPVTVPKRVRRLRGVDEMVVSLVARGMTTGDVQAHLAEVYGTSVSRQQISAITDAVVEKMAEWQNRPLDPVYPVIFIDAINVKIRDGQVANRPI
jgi:putative transposase